jgi:hypothetical protein
MALGVHERLSRWGVAFIIYCRLSERGRAVWEQLRANRDLTPEEFNWVNRTHVRWMDF